MADDGYDLKWKNHLKDVFGVLRLIRAKDTFSDVILYCDNELFHAHKVILAACSTFFERMLSTLPAEKSQVLVMTDTNAKVLGLVLNFMYDGEAFVDSDLLDCFMETAEKLEIRGLKRGPLGDADRSDSTETSRKRVQPSMEPEEGGEKENSRDELDPVQPKRMKKGAPLGIANMSSSALPAPVASSTSSMPSSPGVSQPSVSGHESLAVPDRTVDASASGLPDVQSLHPNLGSHDEFFEIKEEDDVKAEVPEEYPEEELEINQRHDMLSDDEISSFDSVPAAPSPVRDSSSSSPTPSVIHLSELVPLLEQNPSSEFQPLIPIMTVEEGADRASARCIFCPEPVEQTEDGWKIHLKNVHGISDRLFYNGSTEAWGKNPENKLEKKRLKKLTKKFTIEPNAEGGVGWRTCAVCREPFQDPKMHFSRHFENLDPGKRSGCVLCPKDRRMRFESYAQLNAHYFAFHFN